MEIHKVMKSFSMNDKKTFQSPRCLGKKSKSKLNFAEILKEAQKVYTN